MIYSETHNVMLVPSAPALKQLMPDLREVATEQGLMTIVPNSLDHMRLLRNLGYPAPSTITTNYDWCGDAPFRTQVDTAAMLTMHQRAYVLSEMGTGKTRAALHACVHMMRTQVIRKVLVVAPLSTLSTVWEYEITRYFSPYRAAVLHGTKAKRLKQLARNDVQFYIINHDGIHSIAQELLLRREIECVIVDEMGTFRNKRTRRWKALHQTIQGRLFVWGMSGSPTPTAPTDAWAQARLLTPKNVPPSFRAFQSMTMQQVSEFTWIPRAGANDIVFKALQPAVRFTREQCVELPPVSYVTHSVQFSTEQKHTYDKLVKDLVVGVADGTVVARNEGARLNKLLQVCAGFVYDDDHKGHDLNAHDRLSVLQQVLMETTGKVIIFVPFIHGVKVVSQYISKWCDHAVITGETPKKERDSIFAAFQHSPKYRAIVAHPQTMAHGLTLTSANIIVWYSPTNSLEIYEQANARIRRPGQTKKQLVLHLESQRIERRVYKRLQNQASMQGVLLDMIAENTLK